MFSTRQTQTHALSIDAAGEIAAVSADAHRSISLVKLSDPSVVHKLLRHKEARWNVGSNVRWCHALPNQGLLASTCHNVAFIWDPSVASKPVIVLREHKRSVNSVSWHPFDESSTAVATCSADSFIHLWDVRSAQRPVMSFCAWTAGASKIEWSLGNENVLASTHDNEVRLWDRRKGSLSQPTAFINANRHNVRSLAWRPGAPRTLLTVGQDGSVRLWDTDEPRQCKGELHDGNVQQAAWSPCGEAIVTAGGSSGVALWSLCRQDFGDGNLSRDDYEYHANLVASFPDSDKVRDMAWRINTSGLIGDGIGSDFQLHSLSFDGEIRTEPISAELLKLRGDEGMMGGGSEGQDGDAAARRRSRSSLSMRSHRARSGDMTRLSGQPSGLMDNSRAMLGMGGRISLSLDPQYPSYQPYRESGWTPSSRHTIELELKLLEENWGAGRVRVEHNPGEPSAVLHIQSGPTTPPVQEGGPGAGRDESSTNEDVVVEISFPSQYPRGAAPIFSFIGSNSVLRDGTAAASSAGADADGTRIGMLSTLEGEVGELADALTDGKSVCLIACVELIVNAIDGIRYGHGRGSGDYGGNAANRHHGESVSGENLDFAQSGSHGSGGEQARHVGNVPCPVLCAGLFSGPGLFVSFNNGMPAPCNGSGPASAASVVDENGNGSSIGNHHSASTGSRASPSYLSPSRASATSTAMLTPRALVQGSPTVALGLASAGAGAASLVAATASGNGGLNSPGGGSFGWRQNVAARLWSAMTTSKTYQHLLDHLYMYSHQDAANPSHPKLVSSLGLDLLFDGNDNGGDDPHERQADGHQSMDSLRHEHENAPSVHMNAVDRQSPGGVGGGGGEKIGTTVKRDTRHSSRHDSAQFNEQKSSMAAMLAGQGGAGGRSPSWSLVRVSERAAFIDLELAIHYNDVLLHHPRCEACKLNSMHAERRGYMEVAQAW